MSIGQDMAKEISNDPVENIGNTLIHRSEMEEIVSAEMNHLNTVKRLWKPGEEILPTLTPQKVDILHAMLGMLTELGEMATTVKKHIVYEEPLDLANMDEEMGDEGFYFTALSLACMLDRVTYLGNNTTKLDTRYPEGYSNEAAVERLDKVEEVPELVEDEPSFWALYNTDTGLYLCDSDDGLIGSADIKKAKRFEDEFAAKDYIFINYQHENYVARYYSNVTPDKVGEPTELEKIQKLIAMYPTGFCILDVPSGEFIAIQSRHSLDSGNKPICTTRNIENIQLFSTCNSAYDFTLDAGISDYSLVPIAKFLLGLGAMNEIEKIKEEHTKTSLENLEERYCIYNPNELVFKHCNYTPYWTKDIQSAKLFDSIEDAKVFMKNRIATPGCHVCSIMYDPFLEVVDTSVKPLAVTK